MSWIEKEGNRTEGMAKKGQKTVNTEVDHPVNKPAKEGKKKVDRVLKGYRPKIELANQLEILATKLKVEQGKKKPELIDEAITLLLKKYENK